MNLLNYIITEHRDGGGDRKELYDTKVPGLSLLSLYLLMFKPKVISFVKCFIYFFYKMLHIVFKPAKELHFLISGQVTPKRDVLM